LIPDFGGIIWMFIALIEAVIFICVFFLFVFWIMPPISRRFIRLKWSKGSPAFIQHGGRVSVYASNEDLPEGVIHNKQGWFLKPTHPYREGGLKRLPGRPRKDEATPKEQMDKAIEVALRTPILDGLDKQVFFGSADTSLVSNLETLAEFTPQNPQTNDPNSENPKLTNVRHSLLNVLKELIPATMSRTQLDALGTLNYLRGLKVGRGDVIKLVIIAICVIGVLVSAGLVIYFLKD